MNTPFKDQLPLNDLYVVAGVERQEKFESRALEVLFKSHGCSSKWFGFLRSKLRKGTTEPITFDWFNSFAEFPMRFAARRYGKDRCLFNEGLFKDFAKVKPDKIMEIKDMIDLMDSWPKDPVCLVTAYPDIQRLIAIHTVPKCAAVGSFLLQTTLSKTTHRMVENIVCSVEPFESLLVWCLDRYNWDPKEVLGAEYERQKEAGSY